MEPQLQETSGIRLAIEGCGHGTLHAIYASVEESCRQKGWPDVDLLIIGGDFQAVRNAYDLNCVSMPAKYRAMHDFHEYYSGQRKAPYLTVFVGGNHEASNYLFELYYGGWVAPNIYYMGAANVLSFGPLRIAAMSGIWKGYNYRKPHFERLPYNQNDIKSIYHVRELDVRKLLQIRTQVDIGISHDWPNGVEWEGNYRQLFRFKPFLEEDARKKSLGSMAARYVLDWLRPRYWFSAHLHAKYAAVIQHNKDSEQSTRHNGTSTAGKSSKHDDEIDLGLEGGEDTRMAESASIANPDEIELDLGDETPAGNAPSKVVNEDDIDLDLDDTKPQHTGTSVPINPDEIDLELDADDANGIAPVAPGQGLDGAAVKVGSEASTGMPTLTPEAARAALPAAFNRPPLYEKPVHPPDIKNDSTDFLALDKCEPNRHFLQLLEVPVEEGTSVQRPLKLKYDREWLSIARTFAQYEQLVLGDIDAKVPVAKSQKVYEALIDEQRKWVDEHISDADLEVPESFEVTAPVYDNGNWNMPQYQQAQEFPNSQTASFCELLKISDAFAITEEERTARMTAGPRVDPDEGQYGGNFRGLRGRGGHGRGGRGGRGGNRGGRGRGGRGRGSYNR